jgi:carbohydrate kinase (thermoresistant glucokinase family)
MGVSGCGKTSVGKMLAGHLGVPFIEGDSFHPEENIKKMSGGTPLTDDDRVPWLEALHSELVSNGSGGCVLACSALKASYRKILSDGFDNSTLRWIYLQGDFEVLKERLENRKGHFMPARLLKSQCDTLEVPEVCITISISQPLQQIFEKVKKAIL